MYLATVIDCYSKMVVGFAVADHMRTGLVTDALQVAIDAGGIANNAIFHSDRGSQYTSDDFKAFSTRITWSGRWVQTECVRGGNREVPYPHAPAPRLAGSTGIIRARQGFQSSIGRIMLG
ncbi:MAG: DDE-type integrase/transposase/recombinase [Candidatus Microthrix sp.]|nr:DDE-type integrase/transposase/recombinase [Candidatus Microthrix sp.]